MPFRDWPRGIVSASQGRRIAADLLLLTAFALFIGALGPYGSNAIPAVRKHLYWLACIVGGGIIGILIDEAWGRRLDPQWKRLLLVSLAMTPPVTLLVMLLNGWLNGTPAGLKHLQHLLWQVFVISLPVMTFRMLVWRRPEPVIEVRTLVEPPLPEAEQVFRRRLPAPLRRARLIAIEAYDHYLKVHTDAGTELVTMRLADAVAELAGAHGCQVHRSWWIAGDAIEAVRWKRGGGEAVLAGGLTAPVSRTYAPLLKQAGWF